MLLKYQADVSLMNAEGLKASQTAIHPQIKKQIHGESPIKYNNLKDL